MAYCGIMRVEKRGRSAVYGLQIEANRTQGDHERGRDFDRSDIDWTETKNNIHFARTENWNQAITRQIHNAGVKERKDSIVMLDGLYTASPAFFENRPHDEIMDYFKDCLDFHVREYCQGDGSRVINAVVHLDEATPHLQVASVPIVEDEKGLHLSAKTVMGGRADYRARQDRFFDEVTKERGLDRGEVRDPAEAKRHTTKREWQIATQEERLDRVRAELRQVKAEKAAAEQVVADRQGMDSVLRDMNTAIKAATAIGDRIANSDLKLRRPLLGKEGEVSLGSVQAASWELGAELEGLRPVVKALQETEKRLTSMTEQTEQLIESRAQEIVRQTQERLLRDARQADKDRREAEQARRRYAELKDEEEGYILGTAERKAQEKFDSFLEREFRQELGGKGARLAQFCEGVTLRDGRSVLDLFEAREQERQRELDRSWDRSLGYER